MALVAQVVQVVLLEIPAHKAMLAIPALMVLVAQVELVALLVHLVA
jgi:hypothetical protein